MSEFERRVQFRPGYNYLHESGPQSRGQHGMEIAFYLIGSEGAEQFVFGTGWTPLGEVDEHLRREDGEFPYSVVCHPQSHRVSNLFPTGQDLGYHWSSPTWEGQESYARPDCHLIPGGTCYYDGSGLRADDLLREFISHGEDAVWTKLAEEYEYHSEQAAQYKAGAR